MLRMITKFTRTHDLIITFQFSKIPLDRFVDWKFSSMRTNKYVNYRMIKTVLIEPRGLDWF